MKAALVAPAANSRHTAKKRFDVNAKIRTRTVNEAAVTTWARDHDPRLREAATASAPATVPRPTLASSNPRPVEPMPNSSRGKTGIIVMYGITRTFTVTVNRIKLERKA